MIATGQCARATRSVAVGPNSPSEAHPRRAVPTQTRAASSDWSINACPGAPERIAVSISTGFRSLCTADSASASAISPRSTSHSEDVAGSRCFSRRGMTYTRRSGSCRAIASSIAHFAAFTAAREPLTPTTTALACS
jgi:hypothetical protein